MRLTILACAAVAVVAGYSLASPAMADDSALQQLQDAEHSSTDAANASSDEQAKDLSNQGFDTSNTDPAPPPDQDPN